MRNAVFGDDATHQVVGCDIKGRVVNVYLGSVLLANLICGALFDHNLVA